MMASGRGDADSCRRKGGADGVQAVEDADNLAIDCVEVEDDVTSGDGARRPTGDGRGC